MGVHDERKVWCLLYVKFSLSHVEGGGRNQRLKKKLSNCTGTTLADEETTVVRYFFSHGKRQNQTVAMWSEQPAAVWVQPASTLQAALSQEPKWIPPSAHREGAANLCRVDIKVNEFHQETGLIFHSALGQVPAWPLARLDLALRL